MPYLGIRIRFEATLKKAHPTVCFKTSFSRDAAMSPVEKGRLNKTKTRPVIIMLRGSLAGRYSLPAVSDMRVLLKIMLGKKTKIVMAPASFKNLFVV